ncbi:MAG: hypothetical protein J5699_05925 [Bacteroidales bacterium]|nr:hypothetical protein [Bacteroidales bacterium]
MEEEVQDLWHIYSDGTKADIPFATDEEKTFAWNSVAICAEIAGVTVLVSTVNDTHLHTMVRGGEDRVLHFKRVLKQRLARLSKRIYFAIGRITDRKDALSKFMYVYRNCLDFYRKLPGEYPWGSGNIYFSELGLRPASSRMGALSFREQYRCFKTRRKLPEEWLVDAEGRILPESFIDYEHVKELFRSVRTFIAFLYVRREDETALKQEIHRNYLESRSIQDLRRIGNEYCVGACGRTLVKVDIRIRLAIAAKMIRNGISSPSASLAKALLLKPEDLKLLT